MPVSQERRLAASVQRALIITAAFFYAAGLFFCLTKLLRDVPPTAPIAVGRVTIEQASKLRDYLTAALFYLTIPFATWSFHHLLGRWFARLTRSLAQASPDARTAAAFLFATPFLLSPFLYLTTKKEGWTLILPPLLSAAFTGLFVQLKTRRAFQSFLRTENRPMLRLLLIEALSWILFRYLATGTRIAHIPTLFLEAAFVLLFIALFFLTVFTVATLLFRLRGIPIEAGLEAIAFGATPFLLLPFFGLTMIWPSTIIIVAMGAAVITLVVAVKRRVKFDRHRLDRLLAWVIVPALLFAFTYASVSSLSRWIDLFHRGEALGPASDYLRGKVPFLDVFALHGMLEDGLLDAWVMQWFGRDVSIALVRIELIAALVPAALWMLGMLLFRSYPLALLVVLLSFVTAADNQRALLEIITLIWIVAGWQQKRALNFLLAGVSAGLALFFSLEIGIYSVVASVAALTLAALFLPAMRRFAGLSAANFAAGVAIAVTPFLIYLGMSGAIGEFLAISFVEVPRVIDATWSLPFPDLGSGFGEALSARTISDFLLGDRFRFILNPLVIAVPATTLLFLLRRRRFMEADVPLMALTLFALITQRSALGRADFPHQYFSAFLIAPLLVAVGVLMVAPLRRLWKGGSLSTRLFLGTLLLLVLPLSMFALWIPDLLNARLDNVTTFRPRKSGIGFTDKAGDETRARIDSVVAAIHRHVVVGKPMFDFSNQPAFYFFADRPNPTRFYQVPVMSPVEYQREVIGDLERHKPRLVLRKSPENYDQFDGIPNDVRAQAVARYINSNYRFTEQVRGIELWTRIAGRTPLSMASYFRGVKVPTSMPDTSRSIRIFPAAGSIHGATNSFWRSDLIVHNPGTVPSTSVIRYLSAAGAQERQLTVKPGHTVRIEDLVVKLFALPETRGSLVIDTASADLSIFRLRNYDVSRASSGAIEEPLRQERSAVADSPLSTLRFVGLDGMWPRRANVGIVNTGEEELRATIEARTANGNIVGVPVEVKLEEGGSELIVDAGAKLGAPLTESVVVVVHVKRGRAVGYASVIDGHTSALTIFNGEPSPR